LIPHLPSRLLHTGALSRKHTLDSFSQILQHVPAIGREPPDCREILPDLPARNLSCHSFRAITITDLLTQGVPLEDAQYLAGHADPLTTRLYDRRQKQVTRNIVERISV
jgi:integrase